MNINAKYFIFNDIKEKEMQKVIKAEGEKINLATILKIIELDHSTGFLKLKTGGKQGKIYFIDGKPILIEGDIPTRDLNQEKNVTTSGELFFDFKETEKVVDRLLNGSETIVSPIDFSVVDLNKLLKTLKKGFNGIVRRGSKIIVYIDGKPSYSIQDGKILLDFRVKEFISSADGKISVYSFSENVKEDLLKLT